MKKIRDEKGITLIALVITIIVMLILVAVTISMAVNGGLFEYAGRAAQETDKAKRAELELTNLASIEEVEASGTTAYDYLIDKFAAKKKIKFYIKPFQYNTEFVEYIAEEGMTFKEWLQSDYSDKSNPIISDLYEIMVNNHREGCYMIDYADAEDAPGGETAINAIFLNYYKKG